VKDLKGTNGRPNGCSIRTQLTERGIAYGGDPYGNGATVVVSGRESLLHGEGWQVVSD